MDFNAKARQQLKDLNPDLFANDPDQREIKRLQEQNRILRAALVRIITEYPDNPLLEPNDVALVAINAADVVQL